MKEMKPIGEKEEELVESMNDEDGELQESEQRELRERRELIAIQDLEYAESLRTDQKKAKLFSHVCMFVLCVHVCFMVTTGSFYSICHWFVFIQAEKAQLEEVRHHWRISL